MAEALLVAALAAALIHLARRQPRRYQEPVQTPARRHRHHSLQDLQRRHAWSIEAYGLHHPETRSYHDAIADRLSGARRHATYDKRRWDYPAR